VSNEINADDIFNKWMHYLKTEAIDIRYLHRDRPEIISSLAYEFKSLKVDYDTAKSYKKRVMEALTTEEGRKGSGKYKGWKETATADFLSVLASYYVEIEPEDKEESLYEKKVEAKEDLFRYHINNNLITNWCKNRYGQDWTVDINKEAHLIGGVLNLEFQIDILNR